MRRLKQANHQIARDKCDSWFFACYVYKEATGLSSEMLGSISPAKSLQLPSNDRTYGSVIEGVARTQSEVLRAICSLPLNNMEGADGCM